MWLLTRLIKMRYQVALSAGLVVSAIGSAAAANGASWSLQDAEPARLAISLSRSPASDLADGGSLSMQEQHLVINLDRFAVGEALIGIGFDYAYTRFEFERIPSRDRDLHRLQLPLSGEWSSGQWRWRTSIAPGVATSSNVFKDLAERANSDDFLLTGYARAQRTMRNGSLNVGVAHDRQFGRTRTYPTLAWLSSRERRWTWQIGFPETGATYRVSDAQRLSFRLAPSGQVWHVSSDDFGSRFDYRSESWRATAAWTMPVTDRWSLVWQVGRDLDRAQAFRDDNLTQVDSTIDDAWVFGVSLRLYARAGS